MYCRFCGKEINGSDNFCTHCGSAVNGNIFTCSAGHQLDDPFSEFSRPNAQQNVPYNQTNYAQPNQPYGGQPAQPWYYTPPAGNNFTYNPPRPQPKKENNGLAVAGLILSACSVFFGILGTAVPSSVFVSLGFLAIIGLVFSIIGTIRAAKLKTSKVIGIIGIVLGAIGVILWVLCLWMFILYLIIQGL